jgi:outer membrane protein OmpA-like peptidoglycan-associated protein
MKTLLRAIAAGAALCSASVLAETVLFREGEIPDPNDVVRVLSAPAASVAPRVRTRAVRLLSEEGTTASTTTPTPGAALPSRFRPIRVVEPTAGAASEAGQQATPAPRATAAVATRPRSAGVLALPLRFDSNSSAVATNDTAQLDALAEGIKRLPRNAIITIEGHTDAYGTAAYNNDLSLRRAFAVRAYLIQRHGLSGTMLVAVGKGKSTPLMPANPFAPENRRVEFRADYDVAETPVRDQPAG